MGGCPCELNCDFVCDEGTISGGGNSEDVRGRIPGGKGLLSDDDGECLEARFENLGRWSREPVGAEVERLEGGDVAICDVDDEMS